MGQIDKLADAAGCLIPPRSPSSGCPGGYIVSSGKKVAAGNIDLLLCKFEYFLIITVRMCTHDT